MHDAKDLSPCSEDCDRGIGSACARLASGIERAEKKPIDMTRVASLYERACELHDAPSCMTAAGMHAHGIGVTRSRAREIELLVSACSLDVASACAVAAKAFATGAGIARDLRRAHDLYRRACAGGIDEACDAASDGGL